MPFYLGQAQTLVSKLGQLGEGAYWVYNLMSHIYVDCKCSGATNQEFLEEFSPEFNKLIDRIRTNYYKASS